MPPIQIIDKNMGKIYLTNIFHLESILISLLWEFNELMRSSTLNIWVNTIHSKIMPNIIATWFIKASTVFMSISPYVVANIIDKIAPIIHKIVTARLRDKPNLFWIENEIGSIVANRLVIPAI